MSDHRSTASVTLDGDAHRWEPVEAIGAGARIDLDARRAGRASPAIGRRWSGSSSGTPVYGISTGFGALVPTPWRPSSNATSRSTCCAAMPPAPAPQLPAEVVRTAMAVRCNGLLLGHSASARWCSSGSRRCSTPAMCPCVPRTGSLGASGDLAPSAHAFLPLLGEGIVRDRVAPWSPASRRWRALGLEPLALESKEGLALINGTHFMSASAGCWPCGPTPAGHDRPVTAATIDALRGALRVRPRVHAPAAADRPAAQRRQHRRAAPVRLHRRRPPGWGPAGYRMPTRCAAPPRCTAPPVRDTGSSPSSSSPT